MNIRVDKQRSKKQLNLVCIREVLSVKLLQTFKIDKEYVSRHHLLALFSTCKCIQMLKLNEDCNGYILQCFGCV